MRTLIADDSVHVKKSLRRLLASLQNVEIVGEASDVPQAIERTIALKPDILILDIKMPGGTGLDVLKRLLPNKMPLTIIVLTNHASEQLRNECLKYGADFFFDKSSEFEKVCEVLASR